ncbi:MAG TPA: hypothetical protein VKE22_16095 [Haliangiales bacterium]|nr:hypothetical protein [Haliangiales bacterium]
MMRLFVGVGVCVGVGVGACGSSPPTAKPFIESRVSTPGAALLAVLPPGADAVAELDIARLRRNEIAAPLVSALVARRAASELKLDLGFDALADLDVAAAAVYRMGADDAATLFVVRGERLHAVEAATRIPDCDPVDAHTLVVGPDAQRAVVRLIAAGQKPGSLRDDVELARLREAPMPPRATGAVLRVTARLDKAARIQAAGRLGVDEVPATLAIWADVADDAALVALAVADNDAQARRIGDAAAGLLARLTRGEARAEPHGRATRLVWTMGPRAFQRWAEEIQKRLVQR